MGPKRKDKVPVRRNHATFNYVIPLGDFYQHKAITRCVGGVANKNPLAAPYAVAYHLHTHYNLTVLFSPPPPPVAPSSLPLSLYLSGLSEQSLCERNGASVSPTPPLCPPSLPSCPPWS